MITAAPQQPGLGPLTYYEHTWRGLRLLARDTEGPGRIVEVLGEVATAGHVVVLVPGNDNHLGNYFDPGRRTRPRVNGVGLLRTMDRLEPRGRFAVVVWLGYATPSGFAQASLRGPAERGAPDLARLTHTLPRDAHITLVGHSYGAVVCGLALGGARVHDCVVLGSPGMGGSSASGLGFSGRLWAALGGRDWIRFFPRGHLGRWGHGPSPLRPGFGAVRFATGAIGGHCSYYTEDSESVRNIARIALGRFAQVTLAGQGSGPLLGASAPARQVAQ